MKLINIFDIILAINFIIDSYFKLLFDGKDEKVKKREEYYCAVVADAMSDLNLYKIELFSHHPNFNVSEYFGKFK